MIQLTSYTNNISDTIDTSVQSNKCESSKRDTSILVVEVMQVRLAHLCVDFRVIIGPESDHCLPYSVTH